MDKYVGILYPMLRKEENDECTSQSSPEKQNQQDTHGYVWEEMWYRNGSYSCGDWEIQQSAVCELENQGCQLYNSAQIWRLEKCRWGVRGRKHRYKFQNLKTQERQQDKKQSQLKERERERIHPPSTVLISLTPKKLDDVWSLWDWKGVIFLTECLIRMWISSRSIFTDTPRNNSCQLSGCLLTQSNWHLKWIMTVENKKVGMKSSLSNTWIQDEP